MTPEKAVQKVAKSHFVITGRYHGLVIARALGVPYSVPAWSHKLDAERDYAPDPKSALAGIEGLRAFIENNGTSVPLPVTWNENMRNTFIEHIAQENPHWSVSFVQAMPNKTLYDILTFEKSSLTSYGR